MLHIPISQLGLACLAGVFIGAVNFGGLWLTVQRLPASRNAALLAFLSWILRLAFTLGGFYLVMRGEWSLMLSCLVGFSLSRFLLSRYLRSSTGEEARAVSRN